VMAVSMGENVAKGSSIGNAAAVARGVRCG